VANISDKITQIRQAIYGKDVRENIAGGIEDIAADENQFEINITKQQNDYETVVNNQWNTYKQTMDADETVRKSNEDARQANEKIIENNENTRQQNEIVRQNNETDRKSNETAREIAFAGMEHVDANLELSTARGTYDNLNDRLNNSEGETLGNNELITIAHNFNSYPNVRCICTNYGGGVCGAGENPAGGTESYLVNAKICYLDTNSVKIYVPSHYKIKSPVLEKINDNKYILASEDITETKSIQIEIREAA